MSSPLICFPENHMNKNGLLFFMVLFCCVAFSIRVVGQQTANNQLQQVIANTVKAYEKAIGPQSQLYRGAIYEYYDINRDGSPYFNESMLLANGNVKYYGIEYKDVPLLYDQYLGQLVTMSHNNYSKLVLLNEGISDFDIYGHHFIKFVPDALNEKMDAGFYDELYNSSKHQLLVKRVKSRFIESIVLKTTFAPKNTYYLKKGLTYITVNTKGQLFDALKDKKKELKKYLKDTGLEYSENKDEALVKLLTFYDSITN